MILFNKEDLIKDELTNVTDKFKQTVKEFFAREDIKEILEKKDFDLLYSKWRKIGWNTYDLTQILLAADVDFLPYISILPNEFFKYCDLYDITLPENIKRIGSMVFTANPLLKEIKYEGSVYKWPYIVSLNWREGSNIEKVICKEGEIPFK